MENKPEKAKVDDKKNEKIKYVKSYLVSDEDLEDSLNITFSTDIFIQLHKALFKKLITEEAIEEALKELLNDSDIRRIYGYEDLHILEGIKNQLGKLSAQFTEKCNEKMKFIIDTENEFKDNFIERIVREESRRQVDMIALSGLAKGTVISHKAKGKFISNGSNINVRSFAGWLKAYDKEVYDNFKKNWREKYGNN